MAEPFNVLDLFRLHGDAAIVTGAGAGIGKIAATTLASAGARVAVTDIDGEAAATVAEEIRQAGGDATGFTLDVADEDAIIAVIAEAHAAFGRIDILVNNAGMTRRIPTEEFPSDVWHDILAVNLTSAFVASREVGRHMLAAGGGRILNVSSIMGMSGGGLFPSIGYYSTKGALVNFTRGLAGEWGARGIRVNAIAPTFVRTRLTEKLRENAEMVEAIEKRTPMGRFAEPEEVAGGILYLCSRASGMVTGHVLAIDGGWLAV